MHMDSRNLLHRAGVHAPGTPRPKAGRLARVGRDDVHVIAVGRKLLGEVSDQNCGAVDRWKVGLSDEDEPAVGIAARGHCWIVCYSSGRAVRVDVYLESLHVHPTRPGVSAFQTANCLPSRP